MVAFLRAAFFSLILAWCLAQNCNASCFDEAAFGYRFGLPVDGNDRSYKQHELFGVARLSELKKFRCGWTLESFFDVTFALQKENGDQGPKFSTSGEFVFFSPARSWSVSAGLGAGLLTEKNIATTNYGGYLFLLARVGISFWFSQRLGVGYRYQHESNGSIYETNPSVNLHILDVRLTF